MNHLNHTCKRSSRHCFLIHPLMPFLLCSFQVPNTPGIFTSLIRFYLFRRFTSVNQSSPSYKPMHIWGYGGGVWQWKEMTDLLTPWRATAKVSHHSFLIFNHTERQELYGEKHTVTGQHHWRSGDNFLCFGEVHQLISGKIWSLQFSLTIFCLQLFVKPVTCVSSLCPSSAFC